MIHVRISEDALQDLNDGFLFYEALEKGLGDYFTACLRADIERLKVSAGVHRVVEAGYQRLEPHISLWPFLIDGSRAAIVWAVLDLRKDPAWTREQLKH